MEIASRLVRIDFWALFKSKDEPTPESLPTGPRGCIYLTDALAFLLYEQLHQRRGVRRSCKDNMLLFSDVPAGNSAAALRLHSTHTGL